MSKKHKISKSRKKELENEVTETVRKFKRLSSYKKSH